MRYALKICFSYVFECPYSGISILQFENRGSKDVRFKKSITLSRWLHSVSRMSNVGVLI